MYGEDGVGLGRASGPLGVQGIGDGVGSGVGVGVGAGVGVEVGAGVVAVTGPDGADGPGELDDPPHPSIESMITIRNNALRPR